MTWAAEGLGLLAGMPHDPDAVTPAEPIVYTEPDGRLEDLLDELRQPWCGLDDVPRGLLDTVQRATFSEDRTRVALDRRTGTGWRRVAEVDTPEGWPR